METLTPLFPIPVTWRRSSGFGVEFHGDEEAGLQFTFLASPDLGACRLALERAAVAGGGEVSDEDYNRYSHRLITVSVPRFRSFSIQGFPGVTKSATSLAQFGFLLDEDVDPVDADGNCALPGVYATRKEGRYQFLVLRGHEAVFVVECDGFSWEETYPAWE